MKRDHLDDLDELMRTAVTALAPATFHLLFSDLRFLRDFQLLLASETCKIAQVDFPTRLRRDGVLRRPARIPSWLRHAIFHRDKGHCQMCLRDITGLIALGGNIDVDHILPLVIGGTNDPTNFQLLCQSCNRSKRGTDVEGPWRIQTYW